MSLTALYRHVRDHLQAAGVTANVVFGNREVAKQINQGAGRANRVVFAPGDDGGALGGYGPPAKPGRNPRPLWDWLLVARVYVWTFDASAPQDEAVQWDAVVELHDRVVEAIHSFTAGFYRLSAPRRLGPVEKRFGEELVFLLEYAQPVCALPRPRREPPIAAQGQTFLITPTGEEQGC
ncbi:uncharacterized protein SOCEGT47_056950 [Sorangium cellulosum]|uniref:Uncharacterized protein n=1 Tax=Sorangium cellulosum TaxID=56 RepID=A0A4P2Q7A4_SORCE|nr:hypothetical protein [Sorangium cellulosum]AUX25151.1 uncharacterized protein SOCEGT47_056950 [Sorangium cellulosum]